MEIIGVPEVNRICKEYWMKHNVSKCWFPIDMSVKEQLWNSFEIKIGVKAVLCVCVCGFLVWFIGFINSYESYKVILNLGKLYEAN